MANIVFAYLAFYSDIFQMYEQKASCRMSLCYYRGEKQVILGYIF